MLSVCLFVFVNTLQAFRLYFIDIVSVKAVETVQATPGTGKKKRKKRTEAELKEKTDQTVEGLRDKIEALNWLAVFLYQEPTPRFIRRALLSLLSEVKNEVRGRRWGFVL